VHSLTRRVLEEIGIDTKPLRSKSISEVLGKAKVRTAIAVCDHAVESCPRIYPFTSQMLRWPLDDPSVVQGPDEVQLAAFRRVRDEIDRRLRDWLESR
jgi:arsenate reductase